MPDRRPQVEQLAKQVMGKAILPYVVMPKETHDLMMRELTQILLTFATTIERETRKEYNAVAYLVLQEAIKKLSPTDFYSPEQFKGLIDKEWLPEVKCRARGEGT